MPRKKVVIAVSSVSRPIVFEWLAASDLAKHVDLQFLILNGAEYPIEPNLRALGVKVERIYYKNIFSVPFALVKCLRYLWREKPAVIHTHLQGANLTALAAAWLMRVPMKITTRHHSDPYHLKNRHALLYDYLINFWANRIVVASENVASVLTGLEGVKREKLCKIPFGLRSEEYLNISKAQIAAMKAKYRLENVAPIVGMVARYLEIKGLQYAIPAFKKFREKYPNACLVIANAHGPFAPEVKSLLGDLPSEAYREIKMEYDIPALYASMNLFMHVPVDKVSEAFGQAYTESLMSALPAIFTLSGIAPEFVVHGRNARVVPFHSADAIYEELCWVMENPEEARKMAENGRSLMLEKFSFAEFVERHKQLYLEN